MKQKLFKSKFLLGDVLNAGTDYNFLVCGLPSQTEKNNSDIRYSILELTLKPSEFEGEEECWRLNAPITPVKSAAEQTYSKISHVDLPQKFNWCEDTKRIKGLQQYMRVRFD